MQSSTSVQSIPKGFDAAEWQTRYDTAATYRLMARYRMTDLADGFIGGRIPGGDHFFVKPEHLFPEEVRASDLVKMGTDGAVTGDEMPNNAARNTCAKVFRDWPELNGLVHVHTRAAAAVATMKCGLQPVNDSAFLFYGRIGYTDYDFDLTEDSCP